MRLQFLGAARQVTGSRYVLEAGGLRLMIDCGMFQERQFLERNWDLGSVPSESIDHLLLTHAHLDHCGLIPRLVSGGFDAQILTVEPSVRLAEIIMLDAGRIQEEDAAYKKKRHAKERRRGPRPVKPLYTEQDAQKAVPMLRGVPYGEAVKLNDQVTITFHEAGHILGSAILELNIASKGTSKRVVFSGDLGQWGKPLIRDPALLDGADVVVMESTYGDRNHKDAGDVQTQLADVVNDTHRRGGNLVIPTFAVERAQELVYHIGKLVHANLIPDMMVYLDSPMAVNVTDVFAQFPNYLDAATHKLFQEGRRPLRFDGMRLVRSVEESKAIKRKTGSSVIMSASGMCTAGRIKHHLKHNITRSDSTVLFVGYQSPGTLGRLILDGARTVRIHGQHHPVRAKIAQIHGFSAHADRDDLLRWLGHFSKMPQHIFLTHGEMDAATALSSSIESELGWKAVVPPYRHTAEIS